MKSQHGAEDTAANRKTLQVCADNAADLIEGTLLDWYYEDCEDYYLKLLSDYETRIRELLAIGVTMDPPIEKKIKFIEAYRLGVLPQDVEFKRLLTPESLHSPHWVSQIKEYFGPMSSHRVKLRDIATKLLSQPEAISHPEWPELIRTFVDCSEIYSQVALDVYGESVSMRDDEEGFLREEWSEGSYSTLGIVFGKLLNTIHACRHPEYKSLVIYALDAQVKYDYFPEEKIMSMLLSDHVQEHKEWAELLIHFVKAEVSLSRQWIDGLLNNLVIKNHISYDTVSKGIKQIWEDHLDLQHSKFIQSQKGGNS